MVTKAQALARVIQYCANGHEDDAQPLRTMHERAILGETMVRIIAHLELIDLEIDELQKKIDDLRQRRCEIMGAPQTEAEVA